MQAGVCTCNSYFIVAHDNSAEFLMNFISVCTCTYMSVCIVRIYVHGCVGPWEAGG